jgi:3-phosphoshikimate 1-carboxyvinyltransferase
MVERQEFYMLLRVNKSSTEGIVRIPGSKSHTIRALFISTLAKGKSEIINPLISNDVKSAVQACKAFGGHVDIIDDKLLVDGIGGVPTIPDDIIDVGNSGTTLIFAMMAAGLVKGCTVFTGDHQIRRRPLGPLIEAMNRIGGNVFSTRNNGMPPVVVNGRLKGGKTHLDAVTSQYLSSMLISCPLLEKDTEIEIDRLNEAPYAGMTAWWLDKQGIKHKNDDFKHFTIKGNQNYKQFKMSIPGDFSSATFFAVLAAVSGGSIFMENLDMTDSQGDKLVLSILEDMGAKITFNDNLIEVEGNGLTGMEIDMNSIPDALPAMAVAGCFAEGETRLVNVPQARLKETDRIHVMCKELGKMGADIEELPDGLVIRQSKLKGCPVSGHYDHRVVMALAVAGLSAVGETVIDTAEALNATFPEFTGLIEACGGNIELFES